MGWICHLIFEVLGNPRHKHHYETILKGKSIWSSKAVSRLVEYHARKLDVNEEEFLDQINDMTMVGLRYDFFGDTEEDPDEAISEEHFEIKVSEGDKRYNIRGFIDKLFFYSNGMKAIIRDFKTNKRVYKGKEITDNMQSLIYLLAVRRLYPEYVKRKMEFFFLRHGLEPDDFFKEKGSGYLAAEDMDDAELGGLEYQLTTTQKYLESFTEEIAKSNYAFDQHKDGGGYPKDGTFGGRLMCGKDGPKIRKGEPLLDEAGEPIMAYICPFRKPRVYYVLLDEEGKILNSCDEGEQDSLEEGDGRTIEKREYAGCPRHL
tara:strand:- start:2540 stop:3490 length:951 start_codon:yes stop_codon:yes gene_type:complete